MKLPQRSFSLIALLLWFALSVSPEAAHKVKELAAQWPQWADRVGVVPWEKLPGADYKPKPSYAKKSEPVVTP